MSTQNASPLLGLSSGIDHVTIPVLELETAERFYTEVLGAELLERFDAAMFLKYRPDRADQLQNTRNSPLHVSLRFGKGTRLDLFLQDYGQPDIEQPHPHVAFEIGPNLDLAKSCLKQAGVPVSGPLRMGPPGQASLYFLDPFGNKLEFMTGDYSGDALVGVPDWPALRYSWDPH
jgi:catechol 2,3-dioxygenase-like lactoylglutathione lyase family enzyme